MIKDPNIPKAEYLRQGTVSILELGVIVGELFNDDPGLLDDASSLHVYVKFFMVLW